MNPNKCELLQLNSSHSSPLLPLPIHTILPGTKTITADNFTLLNSPIFPDALTNSIEKIEETVNLMCERMELLDAHTGLFLLSHYTSAPRFNYLMRSAPTYKSKQALVKVDATVKTATTRVCNVQLDDPSWTQASLPSRFGGLGLRRVEALSLPCYISSLTKSQHLIHQILPTIQFERPQQLIEAETCFSRKYPTADIPKEEAKHLQRNWDESVCQYEFNNLLNSANQIHSARLLAAAAPHSGAWLHALPLAEIGMNMNPETVRIAVALRLGARICEPHRCRCGKLVDTLGHHGLACSKSKKDGACPAMPN